MIWHTWNYIMENNSRNEKQKPFVAWQWSVVGSVSLISSYISATQDHSILAGNKYISKIYLNRLTDQTYTCPSTVHRSGCKTGLM